MKLFGVSSLLRCAFFRIRLGIPGVIACSTFASNLFLLFGGNILCWNDSSSPAGFMSLSPFCHILCGGASLPSSSKHILKYSFSVQFFRLLLLRWSKVLYYPFLFPSVKLLNVDVRRNESLLFITNFEVLNLNDYKTTKYCPSEIWNVAVAKKHLSE